MDDTARRCLGDGLRQAEFKIERAEAHIADLVTITKKFATFHLELLLSAQEKGGVYIMVGDKNWPVGFTPACLIGDCIHDLRSSLDVIWTALGKTIDHHRTTFPFHETKQNLQDILSKSPVLAAYPWVEDAVLNRIRPYRLPDGNHTLWTITKLDNIDKHNQILVIAQLATIDELSIKSPGLNIHMSNVSASNIIVDVPENATYISRPSVSVQLRFPTSDRFLPGKPVVQTLETMCSDVRIALELFRTCLTL